ncbi:MAG TPA: thiamine-phosphate kinase [Gammaproteobacteria bacterium]|nr:thiamine-phosphate kinase [Gammaproteobacteria bacterium]
MTEFEIIDRYFTRPCADADVLIGVGDDAALLGTRGGAVAVTVDTLVEGVHFLAGTEPDALGHRLLAVNLSDLAAMGAEPRWCTLALTLPQADEAWLAAFTRGFFALAQRFGVSLVGGNLARGPLTATLQLMGLVAPSEALRRSGGTPGDDVYVTGTLGDGAAGLALLRGRREPQNGSVPDERGSASGEDARAAQYLEQRFLRPAPRVEIGLALRGLATAAIDLSDGLVADLGHLCRASGCGAAVEVEGIPTSAELGVLFAPEEALAYALGGGDDYELCFAAPADEGERAAAAAEAAGTSVRRIGRLVQGNAIEWRRGGRPFDPPTHGYLHF